MRSLRSAVVTVVAVVTAAAGAVIASPAPPAGAAGTINVTPSTGLVEGDVVTVSLSGFRPDASMGIAQCPPNATSQTQCGNIATTRADANGAVSVPYTVRRFPGASLDCAGTDACRIGAAEISNIAGTAVLAPIEFAPPGPPVAGAIDVNPTEVVAGDTPAVDGSGWAPNASITVEECVAGSDQQCTSDATAVATRSGAFSASIRARAVVGDDGVECVTAPGTCVIAAFDTRDPAGSRVEVALTFREVPPAAVVVEPSVDLVDGQDVTVRGTNWPLGDIVGITECPADAVQYFCALSLSAGVGEDRTFETTVAIRSHLDDTDCRVAPGACVLYVFQLNGPSVTVPLTFRPPPPPGEPRRGDVHLDTPLLKSGDTFLVMGDGWASDTDVLVGVCPAGATALDQCTQRVPTLETGAFSWYLSASATLDVAGGTVDCTAHAGACAVIVTDPRADAATRVEVPLTIVGPLRGRVDPRSAIGVVEGGTATVTGTAWAPTAWLAFDECVTGEPDMCVLLTNAGAFADGSFVSQSPIERWIPFGDFDSVDCSASEDACELRVADTRDVEGTAVYVPIVFTPAAPVAVTSRYTADEEALVAQGVQLSGVPVDLLQRDGARSTAWIFAAARATAETAPHVSLEGSIPHTTVYAPDQYIRFRRYAARWGYTLEEFQKFGTLFWSWILTQVQAAG